MSASSVLGKGRIALVTGASRGIGPLIARQIAGEGGHVVLTGRSAADLKAVTAELGAAGADVSFIPADLTQPGAAESLARAVTERHGGIDLLVNNAGGDPLREFHTMTLEEHLRTLELNLITPLALSHAALAGMLRRGRGHIVNISAMAGRVSFPYTEVYAAAKDGLIGFTRVLRADYQSRGVSASVLILGAIRGAGQGQRMLDEAGMAASGYMAPAEAVARAVVKAVKKDRAELVVMPGPGRLIRALMDYFPGLGPALNRAAGATTTMQKIIQQREMKSDAATPGRDLFVCPNLRAGPILPPVDDEEFADYVASSLAGLSGVLAVSLGGSRATGTNRPNSDWDFSLYYRGHFDPDDLRALGWPGEIFPVGGWGGGVFNGGAWLRVQDRQVDVHYRDLDDVEHRIAEAIQGRFRVEPLMFHLAGIATYIVVAEVAQHRVLPSSKD